VQTAVDKVYEAAETFTVTLSNPTNGSTIADGIGIGTILDNGTGTGPFAAGESAADDDRPVLSVTRLTQGIDVNARAQRKIAEGAA